MYQWFSAFFPFWTVVLLSGCHGLAVPILVLLSIQDTLHLRCRKCRFDVPGKRKEGVCGYLAAYPRFLSQRYFGLWFLLSWKVSLDICGTTCQNGFACWLAVFIVTAAANPDRRRCRWAAAVVGAQTRRIPFLLRVVTKLRFCSFPPFLTLPAGEHDLKSRIEQNKNFVQFGGVTMISVSYSKSLTPGIPAFFLFASYHHI